MKKIEHGIRLSASDLVGYLNCNHLTELDLRVVQGSLSKPAHYDPLLEILRERGRDHEQGFLQALKDSGLEVVEIAGIDINPTALEATAAAMRAGVDVIAQGALLSGLWAGRVDFLKKVEQPSVLGNWRYEIYDTKLARETKGGTLLQLCLYADLLTDLQGEPPEFIHVVAPWSDFKPQSFRYLDFAAYFRHVKKHAETAVSQADPQESYPEPKAHCDVCQWSEHCDKRRRSDDHLCLVAGISKLQINEFKGQGVTTLTGLAELPLPLRWKPSRGAAESYVRVREQARIQLKGRETDTLEHELLPIVPGFGLSALPAPSVGDIFFDIESDPFVGEHGIEYLFGYGYFDPAGQWHYIQDWALDRPGEKAAFERFIDFVFARRTQYPDLHVYHYAPYEPGALKRLMGRYATRENLLDAMLREQLLVDLYSIVKHSIRASVESYSLKKIEPFFGFTRQVPLSEANAALTKLSASLELSSSPQIEPEVLQAVAGYNEDDCRSTAVLRDWLESLRAELEKSGQVITRPLQAEVTPSDELSERDQKIQALIEKLTHDMPADLEQCDEDQWGRWVLAHMLNWHRREDKAAWWEFFRLSDLSGEELLDERAALSGLEFIETVTKTKQGIPTDRYRFSPQDMDLRGGEEVKSIGGENLGQITSISFDDFTVDIKKSKKTADQHPGAVFAHQMIRTTAQSDSLLLLGEHVAEHGLHSPGQFESAKALLLCKKPDLGGQAIIAQGESPLEAALRISKVMKPGVLAIQGPPGTGKSFTAANMICEFVRAGKKVGITANSHKVIRNLLDKVIETAVTQGLRITCAHKPEQGNDEEDSDRLILLGSNAAMADALEFNQVQVAGGTHFLWSNQPFINTLDVLVVDEAAQMSLANVLAVSPAAPLLIMLGDPCQLEQPIQGSHPEGAGVSALEYVLKGKKTISSDQGLFLETTWRMHKDICDFISEMFYESKLHSIPKAANQKINSGILAGTGLRYLPVGHSGNTSSSIEEVDVVVNLVHKLLAEKPTWTDADKKISNISLDDILIISPYNAQVFEIQKRLPNARIGTVDKFQGQEAPIVIYTMATSSYEDAPRGMEFLYSANRLNVAISRAKCISVVVASPLIFEAECKTPEQMQLANAYCRYLEMCQVLVL
jgi:predicted RecB family nuclease